MQDSEVAPEVVNQMRGQLRRQARLLNGLVAAFSVLLMVFVIASTGHSSSAASSPAQR
jgi:hypothetical protein